MGEILTNVRVFGPAGSMEFTSLMDTGATFTKVTRNMAGRVGMKVRRKVLVQSSTGELIERELGYLEIEIEGIRDIVPVTIASDEEPTVIGYTTLEILGFKVSPSKKLEKTHSIEY